MNERELERLLRTHGEAFGSPRTPDRARAAASWRPKAGIGLAFSAVIAIGVTSLWPRNAIGATLARIHRALTNVTSMIEVSTIDATSGGKPFLKTYYTNNMWRTESRLGTNLEVFYVHRDGKELTDFKNLDFATVRVAAPETLRSPDSEGTSALEYVKSLVDVGAVATPRSISIRIHEPIDGRPAYVVSMDRSGEDYHTEIVVDKQTDLPISSDTEYASPHGGSSHWHADFTFNQPLDASLFELHSNKPTVQLPEDLTKLDQQWGRPLGHVERTTLRQVTVTNDGTVWIATTAPIDTEDAALPTKLTDELGREYLLVQDVTPNAFSADAELTLNGNAIIVTGFVPVHPDGPLPTKLTADFWMRPPYRPGHAKVLGISTTDLHRALILKPSPEPGAWPDYFRYLNVGSYIFQLPMIAWQGRAEYFKSKEDYGAAAAAYAKCAEARYKWVKYSAYVPMLAEADCYRKLGEIQKADDLAKRAEQLRASKIR